MRAFPSSVSTSSKRRPPVVRVADLVLRRGRGQPEDVVEIPHPALRTRLCSSRHSSIRPWSPESEHLGDGPAAELGGTRVVRELDAALELGGERLALGRALGQRARLQPRDRVDEHHRRQLAAGEDVRPDRDRVRAEVREDPLVEALEPGGEERQPLLAGELLDDRLRRAAGPAGSARPRDGRARRRRPASSAAATTSTRSTIPGPPPYGESSTWPFASGVVSR